MNAEIPARVLALDSGISDLESALGRWHTSESLVVLDTNVYLHSLELFPNLPLRNYCPRSRKPHLMILMVNLDELDRQKRVGDATQKAQARAGHFVLSKSSSDSLTTSYKSQIKRMGL